MLVSSEGRVAPEPAVPRDHEKRPEKTMEKTEITILIQYLKIQKKFNRKFNIPT